MPRLGLLRSVLYVPGDKPELFPKAVNSGADAAILDLEDAVTPEGKHVARSLVSDWLSRSFADSEPSWFVRINSDAPQASSDLEAVATPSLAGIVLPKVETPEQVRRIDHILAHLEYTRGLPPESLSLMVIIETAAAVWDCRDIAASTPRVRAVVGGAAAGGDLQRSVGYEFAPSGSERLVLNASVVLGARAAGDVEPLYCGWMDVRDLAGLAGDATTARGLGYTGALVIHPSHVAVVNEVFTPSAETVRGLSELVDAFDAAQRDGAGVIEHKGQMVDVAMARTARRVLDRLGGGRVERE